MDLPRSLHEEVVELTRDLVRLDTSNSLGVYPGNETLVARHLAEYLGEAGIECELVAREEHRANLVARVPGTEPGTPPAWRSSATPTSCRSTSGTGRTRRSRASSTDSGYLHGRGALDMKGEVAARAVAMKELVAVGVAARAATCGSSPSPTRRTAWPTAACAGCSSTAPTSGRTSASTREAARCSS